MQVAITCRHGSIRQDLRDYITQKAEKLLRYLDTVSEIDVTLEFEGPRVDVEMLVEIEGYHTIVAHVEGEDSKVAFDKAFTRWSIRSTSTKRSTAIDGIRRLSPTHPSKQKTRKTRRPDRRRCSGRMNSLPGFEFAGLPDCEFFAGRL